MRLILVHGINQEGKSEAKIKQEWLADLGAGLGDPAATASLDVAAPFYGDVLDQATRLGPAGVTAQGGGGDVDQTNFELAALEEQATAAGATPADIAQEQERQAQGNLVLEQNLIMNSRLNAVLRVLQRFSPAHGGIVMRLLGQAYAYLKRPGVADLVDAKVRPVLEAGPAVVIAHSLGTLVAFKLLRQRSYERRPLDVPLLVTLGSPLTLTAVQAALGPAFLKPQGVARWVNGVNSNDLISLGVGLDASNFAAGIENLTGVSTVEDDPHAIKGYLGNADIATLVADACR